MSLDFNAKNHRYSIDGKPLPGVTTIVRAASSKEGLIQWSANEAVKYVEKHLKKIKFIEDLKEFGDVLEYAKVAWKNIRDTAGTKGTNVHKFIEEYVNQCISMSEGQALHEDLIGQGGWLDDFIKWAISNKVKFLKSEVRLAHEELWFAGTFDLLFEMDGKIFLGDIKTSKAVYPDNFIQLGGYDVLCDENEIEVDHRCVIHLRNELEIHPSYDKAGDQEAFLSCLKIYKYLKRFG